jgi:hypothetical protein
MTTSRDSPSRSLDARVRPVPGSGRVPDLILRLRAAAERLVAFSESRLLLKEAAAMIEGLERERTQQAAEVARANTRP